MFNDNSTYEGHRPLILVGHTYLVAGRSGEADVWIYVRLAVTRLLWMGEAGCQLGVLGRTLFWELVFVVDGLDSVSSFWGLDITGEIGYDLVDFMGVVADAAVRLCDSSACKVWIGGGLGSGSDWVRDALVSAIERQHTESDHLGVVREMGHEMRRVNIGMRHVKADHEQLEGVCLRDRAGDGRVDLAVRRGCLERELVEREGARRGLTVGVLSGGLLWNEDDVTSRGDTLSGYLSETHRTVLYRSDVARRRRVGTQGYWRGASGDVSGRSITHNEDKASATGDIISSVLLSWREVGGEILSGLYIMSEISLSRGLDFMTYLEIDDSWVRLTSEYVCAEFSIVCVGEVELGGQCTSEVCWSEKGSELAFRLDVTPDIREVYTDRERQCRVGLDRYDCCRSVWMLALAQLLRDKGNSFVMDSDLDSGIMQQQTVCSIRCDAQLIIAVCRLCVAWLEVILQALRVLVRYWDVTIIKVVTHSIHNELARSYEGLR
ncbi:hypothetical protein Tco_1378481 [Tanacetum coccineum]